MLMQTVALPTPRAKPRYPDDPENFREGAVVDGRAVRTDLEDIADYVVIGSGAAGASAALVLSTRGYSVILIEEGPWVRTKTISPDLGDGFRAMFRGALATCAPRLRAAWRRSGAHSRVCHARSCRRQPQRP